MLHKENEHSRVIVLLSLIKFHKRAVDRTTLLLVQVGIEIWMTLTRAECITRMRKWHKSFTTIQVKWTRRDRPPVRKLAAIRPSATGEWRATYRSFMRIPSSKGKSRRQNALQERFATTDRQRVEWQSPPSHVHLPVTCNNWLVSHFYMARSISKFLLLHQSEHVIRG